MVGVVGAQPLLLKELECSLLRLESELAEGLDTTEANRMLLLAYNATLLRLH